MYLTRFSIIFMRSIHRERMTCLEACSLRPSPLLSGALSLPGSPQPSWRSLREPRRPDRDERPPEQETKYARRVLRESASTPSADPWLRIRILCRDITDHRTTSLGRKRQSRPDQGGGEDHVRLSGGRTAIFLS